MSLSRKSRLILLLLFGTLWAGLGVGMSILASYERRGSAQILEKVREQRAKTLDRLIQLIRESLDQFVYEYSQWTEAVTFVEAAEPDMAWAKDNPTPLWKCLMLRQPGCGDPTSASAPTASASGGELTSAADRAAYSTLMSF